VRHTISILLQNEAGALSRVAGLFSSRGYNIETLHVAPTKNQAISRLTLVTRGDDPVIQQICNQLLKLVDVVDLEDMTGGDHIEREMLLMKMAFDGEIPKGFNTLAGDIGARVLNSEPSHYTLEVTSSGPALDVFLDEAARYGKVFSVVRSGILAINLAGESIGRDLI
jgi:acetolactate synthase-1/3 small subunit